MDEAAMTRYILETFEGVETTTTGGYTFFFHGAERMMPFATLGSQDNAFDRVSHLDRPGVYRLNIGVNRETYRSLLGAHPAPPGPSGFIDTDDDFSALDRIMPHPTYAPQSWVCVVNPGERTLEQVKGLLAEAYALAVRRQTRRAGPEEP